MGQIELLPSNSCIGAVTHWVADLRQMITFYQNAVGLELISETASGATLGSTGNPIVILETKPQLDQNIFPNHFLAIGVGITLPKFPYLPAPSRNNGSTIAGSITIRSLSSLVIALSSTQILDMRAKIKI